jgi:hypothetical protein
MNPLLRESGIDWLGVVVARRDVERVAIGDTLSTLQSVLADTETARLFQGRVDIGFEGWDDDPRELYEIPEVRTFLQRLDTEWPYWLYFLSTDLQTLRMVTLCLCQATRAESGLAKISPGVLGGFLIPHFEAMNRLVAAFGLAESVNEQISDRVREYFSGGAAQ